MWTLIKNNPWKTAGIAIVLIYVIVSLVKKQWNPMNWFAAAGAPKRTMSGALSIVNPGGGTSNYPPCNNKVEPTKSTNAPCYLGLPG